MLEKRNITQEEPRKWELKLAKESTLENMAKEQTQKEESQGKGIVRYQEKTLASQEMREQSFSEWDK